MENKGKLILTEIFPSVQKHEFFSIYEHLLDSNDDEVRRVCKTPGDPCGCTRQYYKRSGLPLPSPWIKYWFFFSS